MPLRGSHIFKIPILLNTSMVCRSRMNAECRSWTSRTASWVCCFFASSLLARPFFVRSCFFTFFYWLTPQAPDTACEPLARTELSEVWGYGMVLGLRRARARACCKQKIGSAKERSDNASQPLWPGSLTGASGRNGSHAAFALARKAASHLVHTST